MARNRRTPQEKDVQDYRYDKAKRKNNPSVERCLLMTTDPGDLVLDPTCVRKGTMILRPPFIPPQAGGEIDRPQNPFPRASQSNKNTSKNLFPHDSQSNKNTSKKLFTHASQSDKNTSKKLFTRASQSNKNTSKNMFPHDSQSDENTSKNMFPHASQSNKNTSKNMFPHACGRVRGGKNQIPIENLHPGDWVLSHTGKPRQINQTIRKQYRGKLIGIQHNQFPTTLWVTADHYILCKQRTISYGGDRAWSKVPKKHFGRARELRKEMTSTEKILWRRLRISQLGVKFRKQHPIGPYITDFYTRDVGLIIEVDGDTHFNSDAKAYDAVRTDYLRQLGLTVLRFTNLEIFHQLDGVMEQIRQAICVVRSSKTPLQQWRKSETLRVGDIVYFGMDCKPVEIINIQYIDTDEEVYDLEIETDHSYLTEVCAVHNCGGGTTGYMAEQWVDGG